MEHGKHYLKMDIVIDWWPDQDEMGNDFDQVDQVSIQMPYERRCLEIMLRGVRRILEHRLAVQVVITDAYDHGMGGWVGAWFYPDGGDDYQTLDAAIEHHRQYFLNYCGVA